MTLSSLVSSAPDRDPYEKEVLCGLEFSSKNPAHEPLIQELKHEQKKIARELSEFYKFGTANYAPSILKANQYRVKAGLAPFPDHEKDAVAEDDFYHRENLGAFLASWVQAGHGWFSTFRLWLWRFNRFYGQFKSPFLPDFYSLFGVSYGVDLLIDLSIVIEAVFFAPLAPHEENWSWLRIGLVRLKNILLDEQRGLNILNNVLWLTINVTVFLVSPQTAIILNMCGFGADTFVDMAKGFRELWRNCKLFWKARRGRIKIEQDLRDIPQEERTLEQQNELTKLQLIESSLKWKIGGLLLKHGSQLLGTTMIFVGMAFFWGFPPLAPVSQTIMMVGAGLVSGASTLHLAKKIYLSAPGWIKMATNIATKAAGWFNRVVLGNKPTITVTPPENPQDNITPVLAQTEPLNIPPRASDFLTFSQSHESVHSEPDVAYSGSIESMASPTTPLLSGVSNTKAIPIPGQRERKYSEAEEKPYKSESFPSPSRNTTAFAFTMLEQHSSHPNPPRKSVNSMTGSPVARPSLQAPAVTCRSFDQRLLAPPKKTNYSSSFPSHVELEEAKKVLVF